MSVDAIALLSKALDGHAMRAAAIAYNLANISSPQFRSLEVRFETALRQAARNGPEALEQLRFDFAPGRLFKPGEDRREDLMLIDASRNAGRYAALVEMVSRRLAIEAMASGVR